MRCLIVTNSVFRTVGDDHFCHRGCAVGDAYYLVFIQ